VPVIITETVGAKDILVDGAGIVIDDAKSDQLFNAIRIECRYATFNE